MTNASDEQQLAQEGFIDTSECPGCQLLRTEIERLRQYIQNNNPTETIDHLGTENKRIRKALESIAAEDFRSYGAEDVVRRNARKALERTVGR